MLVWNVYELVHLVMYIYADTICVNTKSIIMVISLITIIILSFLVDVLHAM